MKDADMKGADMKRTGRRFGSGLTTRNAAPARAPPRCPAGCALDLRTPVQEDKRGNGATHQHKAARSRGGRED